MITIVSILEESCEENLNFDVSNIIIKSEKCLFSYVFKKLKFDLIINYY